MKMKIILWAVAVLSVLPIFAKETFILRGSVAGRHSGWIYLQKYVDKVYTTVDSTCINKAGKFVFTGKVEQPMLYGLTAVNVNRPVSFFIENSLMNARINADFDRVKVYGSKSDSLFCALAPCVDQDSFKMDSLLRARSGSAVASYYLYRYSWRYNFEQLKALRNLVSDTQANNPYILSYDEIIRNLANLQPGKPAPNFIMPGVDGNPVSLSQFRGKYVLIDFWASWCPDCRKENPNVVAVYKQFANRNFTILGVSLDRVRQPWIAAIAKDGLSWTQVSDLDSWHTRTAIKYAVRFIPANVLVDPQGIIVARDLEGSKLQETLAKVLP